ncbi:hypothetical protein GWK91_12975 [Virgibacillus sp. MSP4-1]|uniref:YycH family regulatory protein n=1 Tax=Virgibacillus sp. MSP4-1 TaxID=2700081 RepID=UPI0005C5CC53|nr:two-component system activity regulator YycH [Virgibacillus sp. MSP4-1]QHS23803.1 hypothetical protein GWK91_12975 [Virgibacillus sp. MSP4-1]
MNLESIKSGILAFLVVVSMVLTLSIWNFSNYEEINEATTKQISINGKDAELNEVILPSQMVFHQQNQSYQLKNRTDQFSFYQDIQDWNVSLSNQAANAQDPGASYVEMIYPAEIPLNLLPNLMQFSEENRNASFPDWSFNRLVLIPNHDSDSITLSFRSTQHEQTFNAEVQNPESYTALVNYTQSEDALSELVAYELNDRVIYLPENETVLSKQTYTTSSIAVGPLINNLFPVTSYVRETSGGRYIDGSRMLEEYQVFPNQKYMRFVNPKNEEKAQVGAGFSREELISEANLFINNHDGWTQDYMLTNAEINSEHSTVTFDMLFNGYPVVSKLGHIEQRWINRELNTYIRPLMRLSTPLGSETVTLRSGEDIIYLLEEAEGPLTVPKKTIEDIQMVYTMSSEEEGYSSDIITLEPAWFMKSNGRWMPVPENGDMLNVQGGSRS